MPDRLVVLSGNSFFVTDARGDIDPSAPDGGFFFADVRHLSEWRLLVDGEPVRVLTSRAPDYYSARVYGTPAGAAVGHNPAVTVRRDRFVSTGVHEDILVENHSEDVRTVVVELRAAADFADIFVVKGTCAGRPGVNRCEVDHEGGMLVFEHEREGYRRATRVRLTGRPQLGEGVARFELELGARGAWQACVEVSLVADGAEHGPVMGHQSFRSAKPDMPLTLDQWLAAAPRLETDWDALEHVYRQSLVDLAALRFRPRRDLAWSLPAAGLPWFMALFGRDSLIASYQSLPFEPHFARTTLEALAALQGRRVDDFRDEQPGRILHELRRGELVALGEMPQSPYYGTHDATPLFLILLDEFELWTGDIDLVRRFEEPARAAIAWMERWGDLDGDGYLEYRTRSSKGLVNQCWKDSWNSMLFSDGRVAGTPIATCEIQGYAYDARRRAARLARVAWSDDGLAARLEAEADRLRRRFNVDFWSEERGHFVLALDGDKRQVDSMSSNTGQLLWTGIVDEGRAGQLVSRLMGPEMFTGWGIRTMSSGDAGYNPIEYHNGTVWPHDTSIIAEGMRRYGFRAHASQLGCGLIEAAAHFGNRLPEVFAGFAREQTIFPVEYPTASSPQAWAAGAPLLVLRTLLGLDVVDGELHSAPHVLPAHGPVRLSGLTVRGRAARAGG